MKQQQARFEGRPLVRRGRNFDNQTCGTLSVNDVRSPAMIRFRFTDDSVSVLDRDEFEVRTSKFTVGCGELQFLAITAIL